ncbi:MAG: metallophosphoesterase family protein [Clostridia bacterium]|nr:metallophosphoesterase family protein [Clostridia bacterium]
MLKKFLSFFVLILSVSISLTVLGGCTNATKDYIFELKFHNNFKIMQLADIQVANIDACNEAFVEIDKLVKKEKPDLIILTGDNLEVPQHSNVLDTLVDNMESYNIPWAPVFGNHDAEGILTKDTMADKFIAAKNCIFYKREDGVDGVGNYVINLKESGHKTAYSLFLIDSNMYDGQGGYDWIHTNQIEWYEQTVNFIKEQNGEKTVPSLAFFHIPVPEFEDARISFENGESTGFGTFRERISPGSINSGFFSVAKELGSTKAIICGHEHINNCDILYQGIRLVYGLKSSRFSYYNEDLLGATIITLSSSAIDISNSYFASI